MPYRLTVYILSTTAVTDTVNLTSSYQVGVSMDITLPENTTKVCIVV